MYLDDPFRTRFAYTDYLQLALAYQPGAKRILFVGLGGGSAPKRMWRDFPGCRSTWSSSTPRSSTPRTGTSRCRATRGCRSRSRTAAASSHANEGPWDVIVVDAFYSDSIPFHLATREFLELARSRLAPGGVVVTNIIGAVKGDESRLFRSMLRTYRAVFPTVAIHPVLEPGDRGPDRRPQHHPRRRRGRRAVEGVPARALARASGGARPAAPDLTAAIRDRVDEAVSTADVPVLTDDYAPTDALLLLFG